MRSRRPLPDPGAETAEAGHSTELRSFGRRRGRRLSARQQRLLDEVLPRLAIDIAGPRPQSIAQLFATEPSEVWLEIGFGGGEHLLWQARANPSVGIIGCEVFEDGLVKALSAIEDDAVANIRLGTGDARELLRWLPAGSLRRVFILFPDPWPKKRHVKRRLINRALLDQLARVMQPGAELRIATDIGDYLRTILLAARGHPAFAWQAQAPQDWRVRGADWPETRYEAKARREGRTSCFLRFLRTECP
jgi:tRNA (guanine-N7-)-methyltransferase